ncbi:MAG: 3-deoxy-D-manno-octulosonic acid transferase [Chitinophagales bacterium]|nr:3-deoxy-D-manno-octulosonic acid transferase [Bacteroidota bacterium]MBP9189241.1 3-deoxy-D-manno-octulosonic acid transferase [Chitinophagales bacterium]
MKNQNGDSTSPDMLFISTIFYNLFNASYNAAIHIASLFNPKAKQWTSGRKNIFKKLSSQLNNKSSQRIWMHCASLGEFEQGRPVLESFRKSYPDYCIVLTFFSPSGYELRKNYSGADVISYLPVDTNHNAKKFLEIVNPQIALFVKYEFWFHYLSTLHQQEIPIILFSSIFRKEQIFFKWYGLLFRKMLGYFDKIFVQTIASKELLQSIHINAEVAADTRFDRVYTISNLPESDNKLQEFKGDSPLFIGGSTWPVDEKIIIEVFNVFLKPKNFKLVIAPHDVSLKNIERLQSFFGNDCGLLSETMDKNKSVLIVNSIGKLAEIYRHAKYVFIGGAFGKGLHNVLEASVYGKPVFFGDNYQKFNEAVELQKAGAAFSIENADQLIELLKMLESDEKKYNASSTAAKTYVENNLGGASKVFTAMVKQLG